MPTCLHAYMPTCLHACKFIVHSYPDTPVPRQGTGVSIALTGLLSYTQAEPSRSAAVVCRTVQPGLDKLQQPNAECKSKRRI